MAQVVLSEIQEFLLHRITTHDALKVVRWLVQHAGVSVTSGELGRGIGLPSLLVEEALEELIEAELVHRDASAPDRYRYEVTDPALDRGLQRALLLFEQDELEVARMLAANSIHRMRRMAYLAYAPALLERSARQRPSVFLSPSVPEKVTPSAAESDTDAQGEPSATLPVTTPGAPEDP